jgi:hypothetical protein
LDLVYQGGKDRNSREEQGHVDLPVKTYGMDMITYGRMTIDNVIKEMEETEQTRPESLKMTTTIIPDKLAQSHHYNENGSVKPFTPLSKNSGVADKGANKGK